LDADGNVDRMIAVSRDITELKLAQTAALQAEKLAATGRLAATIAHEINNPLEAVTNFQPVSPWTGFCLHREPSNRGSKSETLTHFRVEFARVAQIAQQTLGFYRDNFAK
jgi:C4-dicarboxylate-specific signal transduction histidine kinase